jgi:hypothetical protein
MVLFHLSLGLARHCSQEQISTMDLPKLEEMHGGFFEEFAKFEQPAPTANLPNAITIPRD